MPRRRNKNEKILGPLHPNAGITAIYRAKMLALVDEMQRSFAHWITAAYRANEPKIALDATPAAELEAEIRRLSKQWKRNFDEAAPKLASYFSKSVWRRSDDALRSILRKGGISVKFKMTPAMRDIFRATVEANVGLIKSIPEQYLTQVQGAVMRSVQTGRDLGGLTKELQKHYGVTRRRAAFIALDQNNKATSAMTHARQTEIGIEEAIWQHSHAGREPRPTHLANSGKRYKVAEGWYDPDPKVRRRIWPGELIRCRCVSRSIVKGFS